MIHGSNLLGYPKSTFFITEIEITEIESNAGNAFYCSNRAFRIAPCKRVLQHRRCQGADSGGIRPRPDIRRFAAEPSVIFLQIDRVRLPLKAGLG